MARVTVEDCVVRVPNRFELVMLAAQRARSISAGNPLTIDRDNDKNPVVALREIADQTIDMQEMHAGIVKGLQKFIERDEPVEDEMDAGALRQGILQERGEALDADEIMADVLSVDEDGGMGEVDFGPDEIEEDAGEEPRED